MIIHIRVINKTEGPVLIKSRLENDQGAVGDIARDILPGESFYQFTFDDLVEMGDGAHDVNLLLSARE